ncbi:hypothetical protein EIP91_002683 [Steccherinum ochraceum]|uniref:Uncharacterized protein n=1 Tax=Steccherinum ochraceum TaxID=92696 RepID=A0A4V2MW96_9APHY|nr:hypothetical protein EIP91_002683 [Steccherinum ochraceum]
MSDAPTSGLDFLSVMLAEKTAKGETIDWQKEIENSDFRAKEFELRLKRNREGTPAPSDPEWDSGLKRTFYNDIAELSKSGLPMSSTVPRDNILCQLFAIWKSCRATSQQQRPNGATRHFACDSLLEATFDDEDGVEHEHDDHSSHPESDHKVASVVRREEDIAIPRPRAKVSCPSSAKVDTLVQAFLPRSAVSRLSSLVPEDPDLRLKYHRSKPGENHYIGVFAVEDKRSNEDEAEGQLYLDLAAIQRHRRVLCLPDRTVYGAVYLHPTLTMYASWWSGSGLRIASMSNHKWNFDTPRYLLECFYFLVNLSLRLYNETVEDLKNFKADCLCNSEAVEDRKDWRFYPTMESHSSPAAKKQKGGGRGADEGESSLNSTDEELLIPGPPSHVYLADLAKTFIKVQDWRDSVAIELSGCV